MALFRRSKSDEPVEPAETFQPIGSVVPRTRVVVRGKVQRVKNRPAQGLPALVVTIQDDSGRLTAVWSGRESIGGLTLGRLVVLEGVCSRTDDGLTLVNPVYSLVK